MMNLQSKQFIAEWNNKFPLDRPHRKKYSISFGSEEHRALSQVNIFLEWLEDQLYADLTSNIKNEIEAKEQLSKGIWIKEDAVDDDEENRLFDQLKI